MRAEYFGPVAVLIDLEHANGKQAGHSLDNVRIGHAANDNRGVG